MLRSKVLKIFGTGVAILTLATLWSDRNIIVRKSTLLNQNQDHNTSGISFSHVEKAAVALSHQPIVTQLRLNTTPECRLTWNIEKLNVTLYEADRVVFQLSSGDVEEDYIPPLVYSNPQIMLDRRAYLLPDLIWGPNNQLVGFFESIFVAIKLNRTLVLPSFLKHNTDRQFKRGLRNRISPLHRFDIGTLCRYISCITIDHFHRYCNYEIDGIINIRFLKNKELRTIESDTKMKIPRDEKQLNVDNILIPANGTNEKSPKLTFTGSEMKSLFVSKARCVIYPFPFFDVMSEDKNGMRRVLYSMVNNDPAASLDVRLMSDIVKHTPRPSYIQRITLEFIQHMTRTGRFLSAHWRYNEGDYLSNWHCGSKEVNKKRCEKARNYTSSDFANRIMDKAKMLSKRNIDLSAVYIATPRTELNFIQETAKRIEDLKVKFQVFNSVDLEKFIKSRYFGCDFLSIHFEDILSSIEMEVCSRSVSFLGSLGTTWSGNVFKSRLLRLDKTQHEISPDYVFRL